MPVSSLVWLYDGDEDDAERKKTGINLYCACPEVILFPFD